MSVVLRCPSCGTTRTTPGECEACHDAQVRYFCANHTPGLWLDASTCSKCGARFGDPAPDTAPPGIPVRTRPPAAPPRAPTSTSAPPAPPKAGADGWESGERLPPADEEELDAMRRSETGASRMPLWMKILRAAVRAREMRSAAPPETPRIGRGSGGCLTRLVLVLLVLFVVVATALFLVGRALLQWLQSY